MYVERDGTVVPGYNQDSNLAQWTGDTNTTGVKMIVYALVAGALLLWLLKR